MKTLVHPKTRHQLEAIIQQPTGSVIFHGTRSCGKATAARELARMLNCLGDENGPCPNCRQLEAGTFPDLTVLDRGDKASLSIEQVRGLVSDLALQPYGANSTRVIIIDGAHFLTHEAQNALLKLLEEPPPRTLLILITERLEAMLLTVRSRCRLVHFVRPGIPAVAAMLTDRHAIASDAAREAATASVGTPGLAVTLVSHPAEAEALRALTGDASSTAGQSLFQRLILAGRLVSSGTDLERFGDTLHARLVAGLATAELAPTETVGQLDALERFRRALAAKVSPRVALERLMLELD